MRQTFKSADDYSSVSRDDGHRMIDERFQRRRHPLRSSSLQPVVATCSASSSSWWSS